MECDVCGCSDSEGNPVTLDPDPFAEEIKGDNTKVWECERCRRSSAQDI